MIIKRLAAASVVAALILALTACSSVKGESDFEKWYTEKLSPAYDSFMETDDADEAPCADIEGYIANGEYIMRVFSFIKDGKQPEKGEIKKSDGAYYYTLNEVTQKIEFNEKTDSVKVTQTLTIAGEAAVDFITVFSERNGKFYIQNYLPEFGELSEIEFTARGGRCATVSSDTLPEHDIFSDDVPNGFAKER